MPPPPSWSTRAAATGPGPSPTPSGSISRSSRPCSRPGDPAGQLLPEVLAETGLAGPVPVTVVGSHDTASAVVGVPAHGDRFAYIATGTWSLAGLELDAPVLTEDSRRANFTNELGVDGTVRYLRNIMGLWLLQECLRTWESQGRTYELDELLRRAAESAPLRSVVDAGDPEFIAPGRMPERISEACRRTGQPVPRDAAETTRCVLDSLALAHRRAIMDAQRLSGRTVEAVHIVGGGAHNELLCRLTADACGLPVVAGPAEARLSATSWCRPARRARWQAAWPTCANCCAKHRTCGAMRPWVTAEPGSGPRPASRTAARPTGRRRATRTNSRAADALRHLSSRRALPGWWRRADRCRMGRVATGAAPICPNGSSW